MPVVLPSHPPTATNPRVRTVRRRPTLIVFMEPAGSRESRNGMSKGSVGSGRDVRPASLSGGCTPGRPQVSAGKSGYVRSYKCQGSYRQFDAPAKLSHCAGPLYRRRDHLPPSRVSSVRFIPERSDSHTPTLPHAHTIRDDAGRGAHVSRSPATVSGSPSIRVNPPTVPDRQTARRRSGCHSRTWTWTRTWSRGSSTGTRRAPR